jgi:opacity protein-like surface antigen
MKFRFFLAFAIALILSGVAMAQDNPKGEITGDYSYFRANPGLPSYFNSQNLNGGGGQATFYLNNWFGFAADLQGYGSYTQCTKPGAPLSGCASGNLFTYMFGPQIKRRAGKLEPFAEVLLGGAHSNFYANGCTKVGICGSKSPSNNAFSMAIGGGVDIAVSPKFAIRLVDADYDLTRFGNNFTGGNNSQSNFRFQTGVQFRF